MVVAHNGLGHRSSSEVEVKVEGGDTQAAVLASIPGGVLDSPGEKELVIRDRSQQQIISNCDWNWDSVLFVVESAPL